MRLIEKMSAIMLFSRLNGAYKRLLNDDDKNLVIRDIVGFSYLGCYNPEVNYTPEQLIEIRGRQQMAMHILRHLDIDTTKLIEHQNDAQEQGSYLNEEM